MPLPICTRCKKRPAIIFVSHLERGSNSNHSAHAAYCLPCAAELKIGPIPSLLHTMGLGPEEAEIANEKFGELLASGDGTHLEQILEDLPQLLTEKTDDDDESPPFLPGAGEPVGVGAGRGNRKPKARKEKNRRYLSQFCTDLTDRARQHKLDRVIGRDDEIARTVQILCRRSKNNPCLIGEPGVGKTAIAEGLAQRIAEGHAPLRLCEKEIHLLDMTALVAGTQYRGQFEQRIKGLVEEVKALGNVILFIDEVHTLVGAGDAEGSMNAANILKPALSRGEVQIIGATTFNEYRKYIEKDAALERRLQPVKVEEPSIDDTVAILCGIKEAYEAFHKVKMTDLLVRRAVVLSERYISDRFLPDKAIDLLDEACTCANLRNTAIDALEKCHKRIRALMEQQNALMDQEQVDYEQLSQIRSAMIREESQATTLQQSANDNQVTEDDLARVIQLWTGVPAQKIMESDLRRLQHLDAALAQHVIGQDDAIAALCAAIRRSRVQLQPQRRPASFVFVGPTGVGKTELVKRLTNELFSKPDALIRLDMSEFMEKHATSRMIGSPPGYVGYDEAGQLTEKVRRHPYSIVLFDEIEKAHPDVMHMLLQILDEGRLHDAQGREVGFENTVIVMTSNAGSERRDTALGFGKNREAASHESAMKSLKAFLRPEFLGRIDEVIFFNDLTAADYERIANLQLGELQAALLDKKIDFAWEPQAAALLAATAMQGTRGVRDLRNAIRRQVEDPVTLQMVNALDAQLHAIRVDVQEGALTVTAM